MNQKSDVASGHPAEVQQLRDFYQSWWEELMPSFKQDTAIYLGHPKDNPARLTSHDWITSGSTPWNQMHIRKGLDKPGVTGFWNVKVDQAGKYEIRLRRWPTEANIAINVGLEPGDPVPGVTAYRVSPGRAFGTLNRATAEIAGKTVTANFATDAVEAVLATELPAGTTRLTAKFHAADGSSVGAYYAYIERLQK